MRRPRNSWHGSTCSGYLIWQHLAVRKANANRIDEHAIWTVARRKVRRYSEWIRLSIGLAEKKDKRGPSSFPAPRAFICLNCDQPIEITKPVKLFCSEACADEAKFVRYYRRCKLDGRLNQTDVQEALAIRFAHIMAGGYNACVTTKSNGLENTVRS